VLTVGRIWRSRGVTLEGVEKWVVGGSDGVKLQAIRVKLCKRHKRVEVRGRKDEYQILIL
jgi:hypothetical protein